MDWGYQSDEQRLKEIIEAIEAIEKSEKEHLKYLEDQITTWENEIYKLKENIKENNKLLKDSKDHFKQQTNFLLQQKLNYQNKKA
jgi:hypothetical protein